MAIFYADAQVQLRYNNVTKFETTATGVSVTGDVVASTGLEVAGLTYPTADGSAGQQLTTDGSGNLSWADSGSSGSVGRTLFNYAITGTTTTITGTDSNSATLSYTAGQLDVFVNGVRMAPADITATNGTSIVFGDALANGDVVDIIAHSVIDVSQIGTGRTLFNYSISGTPTTVSGSDSNGNTLAYTVGQIDVFVNGVRMAPVDITATNGTSIVFGVALADSDVVDIVAYTAFDVVTNNADDLTSGTVPTARVAGAYTGITSVGTLTGFTSTGIDDNATSTAITIDSSENVGIGTTSPADVRLSLFSGGSGTAGQLKLGYDNSNMFQIGRLDPVGTGSGNFQIKPNGGTSVFDITSAGKICVNGTTTGGDMMKINNNGSSGQWCLNLNSASASDKILISAQSGTGTVTHHQFNNSNGEVGTIKTLNSSTHYNTSSDYRLKENVSYNFDATTRLKQLKPARFNFIADGTDTLVDGFLAHEVSSIVPESVMGVKDAMETYTDDDGNEQTRISPQSIDHSKLVPLLVKTIQELEARITELENA